MRTNGDVAIDDVSLSPECFGLGKRFHTILSLTLSLQLRFFFHMFGKHTHSISVNILTFRSDCTLCRDVPEHERTTRDCEEVTCWREEEVWSHVAVGKMLVDDWLRAVVTLPPTRDT